MSAEAHVTRLLGAALMVWVVWLTIAIGDGSLDVLNPWWWVFLFCVSGACVWYSRYARRKYCVFLSQYKEVKKTTKDALRQFLENAPQELDKKAKAQGYSSTKVVFNHDTDVLKMTVYGTNSKIIRKYGIKPKLLEKN